MTKLHFALLGCGRIAKKHSEILGTGKVNQAELSAVCDIVEERARALGEQYGVPWFTDMHAMMCECNNIDVVNVLTPSGSHAEHTIALAPYGKHIVVEKPMALTLRDADAMIEACDREGIKLFVVKQNRYNLPVMKTRQAFENGKFGKISMGTVRVRWTRTQEYYDQDAWRGTWQHDGGVFANQASHHIDLLEWFLGEPISVFAKSRTALVNIETEDTGVAVIAFANGAIGVVEATTATRPKDLEGSLSILGEKGTVEIGGFAVNEIRTWHFQDSSAIPPDELVKTNQYPPDVYGFGHIAYLENVVDCILNGKAALVDGMTGRKSLELIAAIYESVETGKEVFLRFTPSHCKLGHPSSS